MASDVMSLFNMPTQQQLGQQYLEGMLTSPQQLGAQGLLQQVVSLGGNAGAMMGYGAGRLMGGMTADEVRAKGIDDAMRTVQGLGLTSDAEMYGALSKELANRGLTQDALKARNAGLEAKKAEEAIKYQQGRLGIAQEELKLSQAADKRAAEKAPFELENLRGQVAERADKLKSHEQKIQENAAIMETAPQDSKEYKEALSKYLAAARELEQDRQRQSLDVRKVQALEMQAQASLDRAKADAAKAAAAANAESFTKTEMMKDLMGNSISIGKYSHKLNKFQSNDGYIFNTRKELEDYYTTQQKIKADAAKGGESKKVKEGAPSLSELRQGQGAPAQTAIPIDRLGDQPIGLATPQSWIEQAALAGNPQAIEYIRKQQEQYNFNRRIQQETSSGLNFPQ